MTTGFVVTATDTGVGKTVFSAALVDALKGRYFKPVQAGLDDETDRATAMRLARLSDERALPEIYRLKSALSPHRAAELDGLAISLEALALPDGDVPLIVEAAGGVMTPLTRTATFLDLFERWRLPVILCARTSLGTINHSLLAVSALRARDIAILGIAFIGDANEDSETTIAQMGGVKRLGRLPHVAPLTTERLRDAFGANFNIADFRGEAS